MKFDEATLRQILGALPKMAVFVIDEHMRHWLCAGDPQTLADLGFYPGVVEGSRLGYSLTPEEQAAAAPELGVLPKPGAVWRANVEAVRLAIEIGKPDEAIPMVAWNARYYESTVCPIYDPTGEIIGAVLTVKDVSHRKRNELQREAFARTDSLTQLANKHRFGRVLQRIVHGPRTAAVLMLDLDSFKQVNDQRGHEAGDHCLRAVARALEAATRPTDTVARLSGDEFAVVLAEVASREAVDIVVERICATVAALPFGVTASVGVAMYPADGTDPDALLKVADVEMYRAKKARTAPR